MANLKKPVDFCTLYGNVAAGANQSGPETLWLTNLRPPCRRKTKLEKPVRQGTAAPLFSGTPALGRRPLRPASISLRNRLIYGVAVLVSLAWFAICFTYVDKTVGWGNLFELQPAEFGGVVGRRDPAAGDPVADRRLSRSRRHAAPGSGPLRRHLDLLIYPADDAEARLANITDSLRRQAADLTRASDEAATRAEQVGAMLSKQTDS